MVHNPTALYERAWGIPAVTVRVSTVGWAPTRCRIGESGRQTVEQRYSYQATIPELLRVFSQAMGSANILLASRPGRAREEP